MGYNKKRLILRWAFSLFAMIMLLQSVACGLKDIKSDIYDLVVRNHTDTIVSIYINDLYAFDIEPGKEKTAPIGKILRWHVIAKNTQGEIVFSQEITDEQVVDSGITRGKHYAYIVVISVPEKGAVNDNSTITK